MLSFMKRRCVYFNKSLSEYCTKINNESIRKLTEKYNLERKKPKFKNPLEDEDGPKTPEFNFYHFLLFLSISSITIYFYRRVK